ncbi:MAG: serine/threonine protein kinase [Desulfobulbaceae bacterium]|nr:serine/threonine protein kinase [Desulfobulbaceae bacterium]
MEDLIKKELGTYHIISPLGSGGMASVYKAYQGEVERYVALKVLPRHMAESPSFTSRFTNEAKMIARLEHPHILPIYDFGRAGDYTYLVMRYVKGGSLSNLLAQQSVLGPTTIGKIVSQVGSALDYAHSHGVIHRDVKPANILLDQQGNCLLSDFGIAMVIEGSSELTHAGNIIGTPAYISPEQGLGQVIDGRSDIYSLGVVLYQMVTGVLPYYGETPIAVVIKHIHEPVPDPREHVPDLPDPICRVILKSLAKDRDERYDTGIELAAALNYALRGMDQNEVSTAVSFPENHDPALSATTIKWNALEEQPKKITQKLFVPLMIIFFLLFFWFLHYTSTLPEKKITQHPTAAPSIIAIEPPANKEKVEGPKTKIVAPAVPVPPDLTIEDLPPAPADRSIRPVGSLEIKLILDFADTPRKAVLQLEKQDSVTSNFSWNFKKQPVLSLQHEEQSGRRYEFEGLLYGDNEPDATTFCLFLIGKLKVSSSDSDPAHSSEYLVTMLSPDYSSIVHPSGTWLGWASPTHDIKN